MIFIVGVNGAGKTTTIGKLASKFGNEGAKVGGGLGCGLLAGKEAKGGWSGSGLAVGVRVRVRVRVKARVGRRGWWGRGNRRPKDHHQGMVAAP